MVSRISHPISLENTHTLASAHRVIPSRVFPFRMPSADEREKRDCLSPHLHPHGLHFLSSASATKELIKAGVMDADCPAPSFALIQFSQLRDNLPTN